jgi:hypothetical protein
MYKKIAMLSIAAIMITNNLIATSYNYNRGYQSQHSDVYQPGQEFTSNHLEQLFNSYLIETIQPWDPEQTWANVFKPKTPQQDINTMKTLVANELSRQLPALDQYGRSTLRRSELYTKFENYVNRTLTSDEYARLQAEVRNYIHQIVVKDVLFDFFHPKSVQTLKRLNTFSESEVNYMAVNVSSTRVIEANFELKNKDYNNQKITKSWQKFDSYLQKKFVNRQK